MSDTPPVVIEPPEASLPGAPPADDALPEGCVAPPYGASHYLLVLRLEDQDGSTLLKVSDTTIGRIDENCDKAAGWRNLFEGSFKPYAESLQSSQIVKS